MKVLITSPRGKENLVKAFEDVGWTVVNSLLELPDLIVPTVDEELPFFAANREWFKAQGVEVLIASSFTIDTCRDKAEFNLFCGRHGFKRPPTYQPGELASYIKPRFGKGSRGIVKVDSSCIIQTECPYPEVSVDYFTDLDGKMWSVVPRFRLNVVNGESKAMMFVPNFNVREIKRLGKELGLVGHNVIQGYWTGKEFIFGEVNPRYGGGSWMTFDFCNTPRRLLETMRVHRRGASALRH